MCVGWVRRVCCAWRVPCSTVGADRRRFLRRTETLLFPFLHCAFFVLMRLLLALALALPPPTASRPYHPAAHRSTTTPRSTCRSSSRWARRSAAPPTRSSASSRWRSTARGWRLRRRRWCRPPNSPTSAAARIDAAGALDGGTRWGRAGRAGGRRHGGPFCVGGHTAAPRMPPPSDTVSVHRLTAPCFGDRCGRAPGEQQPDASCCPAGRLGCNSAHICGTQRAGRKAMLVAPLPKMASGRSL